MEGHLLQEQLDWCDDMCKLRYLRARQYNVDKAEAMLRETLKWREEYKPHLITVEDIFVEINNPGKMYVNGKDKLGRPVVYMKPRYDNSHEKEPKVKYMVYLMEQCCRMMDAKSGVEKLVWFVDHRDAPVMVGPAKMSIALEILHVVQNHYPERLGVAYHIDPPFLLNAFFKVLHPFMDEVTKKKSVFVSGSIGPGSSKEKAFSEYFTPDLYETEYGGTIVTNYDVGEYSRRLAAEDAARITPEYRQRIV
eukprot:TRINITY_DN9960_c0_g1_i1.p1 TRINITY_DN9960_c0_g1~~TRINITY_DN9960_c0_g1_i1.p1  ORF type:complete len:250 (-),score=58.51 TRINITY_DN9960_c0_g1_i1:6-755(-)